MCVAFLAVKWTAPRFDAGKISEWTYLNRLVIDIMLYLSLWSL